MADLVQEMDLRFGRTAPEFVGDPKRSLFPCTAIFASRATSHRTRRTPPAGSSTAAARPRWVGKRTAAGRASTSIFSPGRRSWAACWMPPRPALLKFRAAIAGDLRGFERIVLAPALRRRCGELSDEESLKRVPRGYAQDHLAARWLRHQSFTVGRKLTDAQVTSPRLTALLENDYATMLPLVRWLNGTLGLAPLRRR